MNGPTLITGGLGYIGARLAKAMLDNGGDVWLGTRRKSPPLPQELEKCRVVPMHFGSDESLETACDGVSRIVHLAAMNDAACNRCPITAFEANVIGTFRLLQAARKAGVVRFLYLSTAHVYRSPLTGDLTEETVPRPESIYGITHRAAEDLVLSSRQEPSGVVVRLSNGFGAPIAPQTDCWMLLVNDLCHQAVTTGKLVLRSSGEQYRNFISMSDVVRALQHFVQLTPERLGDRLFNVGGRESLTVLQMTELIADRCEKVLGFRPPIERQPFGIIPALPVNYSVLRAAEAGFSPGGDLSAEIDRCLDFCRRFVP